jgi:hypothetical protein
LANAEQLNQLQQHVNSLKIELRTATDSIAAFFGNFRFKYALSIFEYTNI